MFRPLAVAKAKVGDLERTDTEWFLLVTEKGKKLERKPLQDAAEAVLAYVELAGIADDKEGPLFRPFNKDRRTLARRHLTTRAILNIFKQYGKQIGLEVNRVGRRGICTHTARKTGINDSLKNGANVLKVQNLAGHADVRTTQGYYVVNERDAEDAARHIHIRPVKNRDYEAALKGIRERGGP